MSQPHWPFGDDPGCLARIHPGNAQTSTPKTLAYPTFEIKKAPDGNRDPRSGWTPISRKEYAILVEEKDPVSGLPVVSFIKDPRSPDAVAQRQAAERAKARKMVGLDVDELRKQITADVVGALKDAGVISTPSSKPSSEPEAVAPSSEEEASASEGGPIDLMADDPEPEPEPKKKVAKKRPAKKKRGRLRLSSSEG